MNSTNLVDFHTYWFRFSFFELEHFCCQAIVPRDDSLEILNIWENSCKKDSYEKKIVQPTGWKIFNQYTQFNNQLSHRVIERKGSK